MAVRFKSPLIIGLTGRAKSGKDTAARAIRDFIDIKDGLNHYVLRKWSLAFADPIREIGKQFGFTHEQLTDQNLKESFVHPVWNVTPRQFMQKVGTDMFRDNLDKDCWVKLMIKKLVDIKATCEEQSDKPINTLFDKASDDVVRPPTDVVLITDVRFPNELKAIKNAGGVIVRIKRYGIDGNGEAWRAHESEKYIDELNVDEEWINNLTSAADWQKKVYMLFEGLCERMWKIKFQ